MIVWVWETDSPRRLSGVCDEGTARQAVESEIEQGAKFGSIERAVVVVGMSVSYSMTGEGATAVPTAGGIVWTQFQVDRKRAS